MKKLSESVWNDIRKRGLGTEIKKEDEMTQADFDALNDCIFEFATRVVWDNWKYSRESFCKCVYDYTRYSTTGEKANVDNILKYVNSHWENLNAELDDAIEREQNEKDEGMNESVWNDIRKRGLGDEVKQEDKGITLVIDGVKYTLMKDFWGLGDVYEEENSDPWRCFAFNRPENSPTVIWGDTEIAGVFGCDKWDIGEDEYDVYVLRDYIDKDRDDYIDELIKNGRFKQMYSSELEIQDILVKYTKKIFEDNHMSDFAKFTIYDLIGTDYDFGGAILYEDDGTWYDDDGNPTIPPCELEDVDYDTVKDIHIITYPMLDNWYEDLKKELIDTYTKLGWVHLKEFELDYENNPSGAEGVAFIKFKD